MVHPALQSEALQATPGVLRLLRQTAGFTRVQAAARIGVHPRTLQAYERGERQPRRPMLIALKLIYHNGRQAQNRRVERAYKRGLADRRGPLDH